VVVAALDIGATKAAVCRTFDLRRNTLIDGPDRLVYRSQKSREAGVMRRQQLSETQIAALFDPTTDPRELVRHHTLSEADIAIIRRCRGDHSRLGYALMLCYLRHLGRQLRISEQPPAALVSFVARQIDVRPETIDDYLSSEQNRRRHAAELQNRLRLRPFSRRSAAELASWLLPHAIENHRLAMHDPIPSQGQRLRQVVTGFFAYHAVPTNGDAQAAFRYHIMVLWMRMLTRRSQKDRIGWDRINRLAAQWLPKPRILHPWPNQRFAVKHPRWEPDAGKPHVRFCAGCAL
jgi:hypothetical protein